MAIGFDSGTYNLICCQRRGGDSEKKNDFVNKKEINAFLELPLENKFVFNMMKKAGVPLIERVDDQIGYALGEAAVNMAYTMPQIDLKRPMRDGCLNPSEKDAMQVLKVMIHSLIGNIKKNREILYYSVPANAINAETDADYHSEILKAIFSSYKSKDGHTVDPRPIQEGLALVFAELAEKQMTGIGISCGAGLVNVTFAIYSQPAFDFAIANSGDWIDKMSAKATGESQTFINQQKMKIDLSVEPQDMVERAIQTQYRLMILNTVKNIKKGLSSVDKKARTGHEIDVVIAGGTSLPKGFDTLFAEILTESKLDIKIGKIVRPKDPLYSVARGCLIAAENAQE